MVRVCLKEVQLIDAGQLYRKLRKNLGAKNCEFAPEHIQEIVRVYSDMQAIERKGEEGVASRIFDNQDFGYYKVTVERPKRLKAQFTAERIAELRFDKTLREPMEWAWLEFGEEVCTNLKAYEKAITDWCEKQDLNLNSKKTSTLTDPETWEKQRRLMQTAEKLMAAIGINEFNDFNQFSVLVEMELKARGTKLSASEKNAILSAVTWYDAEGEKVVKGTNKLNGGKLEKLLEFLGCEESQLADFGYYPTAKKGEYLEYETESDLRDTENVPLKEEIYPYFLKEVKPHVAEAWINLEVTKIGYEISFNKYFYRHKPLRSLEEVAEEILELERESDGLIQEILSLS